MDDILFIIKSVRNMRPIDLWVKLRLNGHSYCVPAWFMAHFCLYHMLYGSLKLVDSIMFTVSFVNNGLGWLILIIANAYDSTVGNIALDKMSCLFLFLPLSFLLSLILSLQRQSCSTYPTPPLWRRWSTVCLVSGWARTLAFLRPGTIIIITPTRKHQILALC